MSSEKLIFYDLRCRTESCWSPSTWKTRLALNFKQISYEVVWLSYPDIKSTIGKHCQQDAEKPTLPVIQHGDTWVYDSWQILLYLEKTFPGTPSLLTPSVEANYIFDQYYENVMRYTIMKEVIPRVPAILDDRGAEYFHRTRTATFGMPLDEWGKGATIDRLEGPLTPVHHSLKNYGPYVCGSKFSYHDVIVMAMLLWILRTDKTNFDKVLAFFGDDVLKKWWDKVIPLAGL